MTPNEQPGADLRAPDSAASDSAASDSAASDSAASDSAASDSAASDSAASAGAASSGASPTLDTAWTVRWIRRSAEVLGSNRAALNTLDRDIGDGDHGENMDRGFQAILPKLDGLAQDTTPGAVLKLVATTLISTVGGAAGPLYGTAFLKASGSVGAAGLLDAPAVVALLTAARDGIVLRGKAEEGDKTMIDSWSPAVQAAEAALAAGSSAGGVLLAAADAAGQGAQATEPLVARKGRASYLGERAIGHRDPGSQSTALLLRAAVDEVAVE